MAELEHRVRHYHVCPDGAAPVRLHHGSIRLTGACTLSLGDENPSDPTAMLAYRCHPAQS